MAAFDLKRKVNDSAQREHENAAKAFREMPEEEEQQQQHEEPPEEEQLTETIKLGLLGMTSHQESIIRKIDELMEVGSSFLDNLKEQFLVRMEKVKRELHEYCNSQAQIWTQTSLETLQAQERLYHAQALMQRLGLKANGPTESEGASVPAPAV